MSDDLQKEIAQLAQKLGTTVDHLWSVLVRQAPIDSTVFFLTMAAMAGVTYALWRLFSKSKVNSENHQGECVKLIAMVLFGLMLAATFVVLTSGLSNAIAGFFNPEYWALQDLLAKIHGD
jgi:hypothetical protein